MTMSQFGHMRADGPSDKFAWAIYQKDEETKEYVGCRNQWLVTA